MRVDEFLKEKSHFSIRHAVIGCMGFERYSQYLHSKLWTVHIKPIVFDRDSGECVICGRRAYAVHHVTYNPRTLIGKELDQLFCVCEQCHSQIEFDLSGYKLRTCWQVHERFSEVVGRDKAGLFNPRCFVCGVNGDKLVGWNLCGKCNSSGKRKRVYRELDKLRVLSSECMPSIEGSGFVYLDFSQVRSGK